jgi:L-alanine-DL-glutamate epimerase-like enolase superfamily enzyme
MRSARTIAAILPPHRLPRIVASRLNLDPQTLNPQYICPAMKITRLETIPIRVPIKPELAIRSGRGGSHSESPFLIVKVHTDEGLVGLGEVSCTPRWSGEDQVSAAHFIDAYFAPLLIGESLSEVADIQRLTTKYEFPVAGNHFTKAGVEMALWDLLGKSKCKPVYELLGGKVREFVPIKWSISGSEPDKAATIGRGALDRGFTAMKVKVGLGPDNDVARVRAVREAIGDNIKLGVDANGGWPTAEVAVATIHRLCDAANIAFAEQPVPAGDHEEMAAVRRQVGVPVIADESLYTLGDARALVRAKACDVFSVYIGKAGGIGPAKQIADFALAQGIQCTIGSNLELGVGAAAMLHLGIAHRGIAPEFFPCDIIGPFYYEDEILREPLALSNGLAVPNDRSGLGVELDETKIDKYRVM